jgi:ectonucleoside triphosphate diphosphohydrolase 5/6
LETALKTSGFKPETPLVEIMNPRDEGLYGWFTVNFLLDLLSPGSLKKSFASLDLGGGSTQITFAPEKIPVPGLENRKHFMHEVKRLKFFLEFLVKPNVFIVYRWIFFFNW